MEAARPIGEFCRVLRGLGVRVSTPEALDAAAALLYVDWRERDAFRAALRATLIKRLDDLPAFEQAFAAFFAGRDEGPAQGEACPDAGGTDDPSAAGLAFQGKPLAIPEELKQVYGKLAAADKERLQAFLEKTSGGANVQAKFLPIAERMVVGSLEYWRRQLAAEETQGLPVHYSGDSRIDTAIDAAAGQLQSSLPALYERDLSRVAEEEVPQVIRLIKQLTKALASQVSRRQRRSNLARRLDLRGTIRGSLRYGGVPLRLRYKASSKTKPKVLLLCDVSGSMARYVAFVLQFIYGLAALAYNMESFIFAEDLERVTRQLRRRQPFSSLMSRLMAGSGQWGKGTNLHDSLVTLRKLHGRVLQPATVVIILSDGKSLRGEAAALEMARLRHSVKKIIWLNTLPASEWSRQKTTSLFQKYSQMVPCNTLADLTGIVRSELFRLRR